MKEFDAAVTISREYRKNLKTLWSDYVKKNKYQSTLNFMVYSYLKSQNSQNVLSTELKKHFANENSMNRNCLLFLEAHYNYKIGCKFYKITGIKNKHVVCFENAIKPFLPILKGDEFANLENDILCLITFSYIN